MYQLIFLGGAAYLAYLLTKGKAAEKLNFFPKEIRVKGTLQSPAISFVMDVQNPSAQTIPFDSFIGNLYAGENIIGRVEYKEKTYIKAQGSTTLVFPVKLFAGGALSAFLDLLLGKKVTQLKIVGTAHALGMDIPIEKTQDVKI